VTIRRSGGRVAARRLATIAQSLLDASTLCAIASVARGTNAYVNTAYFAWSDDLDVVWVSHPDAQHSRNVDGNGSAAVAVFDSAQTWGKPDRGIQLFGAARQATGRGQAAAEALYARRFPDYRPTDFSAYRLYVFRPRRVKLFDERALGAGVFVTAKLERGRLAWQRTDVYHATERTRAPP
jgi:uncharacterized protein YhbP (UPF0306 family)